MNKIILLGRLTKNPEIKFSQANNTKVANFSFAVNRKYVKQGEERHTNFFNIVVYSKLADFAEKYLKQGLQILVSGRLQNRSWNDSNGQKRYITEVIAEEIDFADSPKKTDDSNTNTTSSNNIPVEDNNNFVPELDDLPF